MNEAVTLVIPLHDSPSPWTASGPLAPPVAPNTCNLAPGLVVPMPTLPSFFITIFAPVVEPAADEV